MRRPHYAWVVCLGTALMLFTVMGLGVNVFSLYQPYIIAQNGFTNAQGALIITFRSLFILVGMATGAWMYLHAGLRVTAALAIGLMTLSSFLFGLAASLPVYCLAGMLTGLGYSWGGMIPVSLLINGWFRDRQTFALGVGSMGSGAATILAPAPLTWLIEHVSLRCAFWAQALVCLVMGLVVWAIVRDAPAQLGLAPYTDGSTSEASSPVQQAPAGMTKSCRLMLLLAVFLMGPASSLGLSTLGLLYADEGYSPAVVAAMISLIGLILMIVKPIYGQLVDRMGGRQSNYLIYAVALASYGFCLLAPTGSLPLAYASAVVYGCALPIGCMSLSVWARDCFGDEGFAQGLKWCQIMFASGNLVFGPVPGLLADRFGSYLPTYWLFLWMMVFSMVLLCGVYLRTRAGSKPNH